MKRDGTGLKESGGEGIACGGNRSVVTRIVVTRGVATRGVVWIHDLGVLQEERLRGVYFAVFASPCIFRRFYILVLTLKCLLQSSSFEISGRLQTLRSSDFAGGNLCVYYTLRVTVPR